MNVDPSRRDTARLVALAEAIADLATDNGEHDLARFARGAACRFQACVLTADPQALAVSRLEVDRMLRAAFPNVTASVDPPVPPDAQTAPEGQPRLYRPVERRLVPVRVGARSDRTG